MSEYICLNENVYAPGVDVNIDVNLNPYFILPECGCINGTCSGNSSCNRWSKNVECETTGSNIGCTNQKSQRPNPYMEQIFFKETRFKGYCLYTDHPFISKGTILGI